MQDTSAYEVEVVNTDDSGALSAPDGVTLSYLLSHFNADTSSKNFDWSLPKSASDWLSRLQRCAYISASSIASSVNEGHFFIPQLFDESKGSFSVAIFNVLVIVLNQIGLAGSGSRDLGELSGGGTGLELNHTNRIG